MKCHQQSLDPSIKLHNQLSLSVFISTHSFSMTYFPIFFADLPWYMCSRLYCSFINCPFYLLPLSLYILCKQLRQLLISVTLTMAGGWFSPPPHPASVLQMVCPIDCCRGSGFVKLTAHVTGNGGPCLATLCHTVDHAVTWWSTPVTVTKPRGSLLVFMHLF